MTIDTNAIVSATEANQNFSRVTRIAKKNGQAVIFKNNRSFCLYNSKIISTFAGRIFTHN